MHTSDLHGEIMSKVHNKTHLLKSFDVWVDTGDFFDNYPIITGGTFVNGYRVGWQRRIDRTIEVKNQTQWLKNKDILKHMVKWLDGRPFVSVAGNHDFISLAQELKDFGYENVHEVTPEGFELFDLKWAGFANINYIQGEWNHETSPAEFDNLVERIDKAQPDMLICHSPPRGIFDVGGYYTKPIGIGHLTNYFTYKPHKIKYMLFGHCHEQGGKKKIHEDLGITFVNGARCCSVFEI